MRIAFIDCGSLVGSGILFNLGFDVVGGLNQLSPLTFTGETTLHDDADTPNEIPLQVEDGSLTVQTAYIRGDVNGDGVVIALDALWALRIAVGRVTPTHAQFVACDVNGDERCNAGDVTLILCYAVRQDWDQCGGATAAEMFTRQGKQTPGKQTYLRFGKPQKLADGAIAFPITIENGADFAGGDFAFTYDKDVVAATASLTPLTIDGFDIDSHLVQPGLLRVSLGSDEAITADGPIFQVELAGDNATCVNLKFADLRLNDASGRDFVSSVLQNAVQALAAGPRCTVFIPVAAK